MLFDAQRQVLEGKQRVLARFLQRIVEIDNSLAGVERPAEPVRCRRRHPDCARSRKAAAPQVGPGNTEPMQRMRSQEDLRRDIVRQLHDGPAQSLANIALQGEIVERLVRRSDARGIDELGALRQMVQQALDTTKEFIFEVRPMVLDDLGLVPTLRRATQDRARRSGIASTSIRTASSAASRPTSRARCSAASTRPSAATSRSGRHRSSSASTGPTRSSPPRSRGHGHGRCRTST